MEPFFTTLQIVTGVLLPVIGIFLLWVIKEVIHLAGVMRQVRLEEVKRKPPFDEIESSIRFEDNALQVRLVKNGETIYKDTIDRSELEG